MTAASMATGGAAMAGKAMMGAATGAVGGASAIQAAFQKASASMGAGGDMPSMGSIVNDGSSGGGDAGTAGSSPFAQAAGFSDSGSSSSGGGFARAAKLAAGTASELVKGVGSQMQQGFQERVAETTGGKLAAGIRANIEPEGSTEQSAGGQQFEGNSLGGDAGNSDKSSGGWMNQTGGFSELSEADQAQATESHAEWQAKSEGNTFGVEDYVSYVQERQQERNAEVASFVNNENKNDRG